MIFQFLAFSITPSLLLVAGFVEKGALGQTHKELPWILVCA
jgi:hypothetical protein